MTEQEQRALLTACLMAAFADGTKDDRERDEIKRIAEAFTPGSELNLAALYQDVLLKRRNLEHVASALTTPELRQLAYEMAVCVCDADGASNAEEQSFLDRLRAALALEAAPARAFAQQSAEVANVPLAEPGIEVLPASSMNNAELDKMILNYSILNGALELLP